MTDSRSEEEGNDEEYDDEYDESSRFEESED